jgi:hypothetical protein
MVSTTNKTQENPVHPLADLSLNVILQAAAISPLYQKRVKEADEKKKKEQPKKKK